MIDTNTTADTFGHVRDLALSVLRVPASVICVSHHLNFGESGQIGYRQWHVSYFPPGCTNECVSGFGSTPEQAVDDLATKIEAKLAERQQVKSSWDAVAEAKTEARAARPVRANFHD